MARQWPTYLTTKESRVNGSEFERNEEMKKMLVVGVGVIFSDV